MTYGGECGLTMSPESQEVGLNLERPEVEFWFHILVTVALGKSLKFLTWKTETSVGPTESHRRGRAVCKAGTHTCYLFPGSPNLFPELELMGLVGLVAVGYCRPLAANDTRWLWRFRLNIPRASPVSPLNLDLGLDLFRERRWVVRGEGPLGADGHSC